MTRHGAIFLAITILAFAAAAWFVPVTWPISVLGTIDADRIRQLSPHHLVNPDWISAPKRDGVFAPWILTEMKARAAVIFLIWALLGAVIWRAERRAGRRLSA